MGGWRGGGGGGGGEGGGREMEECGDPSGREENNYSFNAE